MTIMVIERFRHGPGPVRERFLSKGRLLPEGVEFVVSWITADGQGCFQLMETPDLASLDPWIANWRDLVDFEVVEIQPSNEFWSKFEIPS